MTPSMSRPASRSGLTGKPSASRRARAADWLVDGGGRCGHGGRGGAAASNRPASGPGGGSSSSWYSQVASNRPAVTAGSFWRSEPAPLLRGLA